MIHGPPLVAHRPAERPDHLIEDRRHRRDRTPTIRRFRIPAAGNGQDCASGSRQSRGRHEIPRLCRRSSTVPSDSEIRPCSFTAGRMISGDVLISLMRLSPVIRGGGPKTCPVSRQGILTRHAGDIAEDRPTRRFFDASECERPQETPRRRSFGTRGSPLSPRTGGPASASSTARERIQDVAVAGTRNSPGHAPGVRT